MTRAAINQNGDNVKGTWNYRTSLAISVGGFILTVLLVLAIGALR